MATTGRFPEFNDEQLMELLDDKLSDRSKNTIKYSFAVLACLTKLMQLLAMEHDVRWRKCQWRHHWIRICPDFTLNCEKKTDHCTRKVLLLSYTL